MDKLTEQEMRAFVGRKADYYLQKWQPSQEGTGSGTGFNWAAFVLSGLWLPYRKMYLITIIFFGIILLESILEEIVFVRFLGNPETPAAVGRIVGLVAAIICGACGNQWYLSHTRKVVAKVRSQGLTGDAQLQTLARRGGTSILASLGFFAAFLFVVTVPFILWNWSLVAGLGKRVDFGGGEEIYYTKSATEAEAQALGAYLREAGYFDGQSPKTVRISRNGAILVISFVVQASAVDDPQAQQLLRTFGEQTSQQAFGGQPVEVEMCDEYLNVKKRL